MSYYTIADAQKAADRVVADLFMAPYIRIWNNSSITLDGEFREGDLRKLVAILDSLVIGAPDA